MIRSALAAVALLWAPALLAQATLAPTPPAPAASAPSPGAARADTTSGAPDSLQAVRRVPPQSASAAALARAVAASRDSALVPRGPHRPFPATLAGVVWKAPARTADAIDDLIAMRRAGVRSVRTDLLADTTVLRAASVLGLALYQDLPVESLPAAYLVRQTDRAEAVLVAALRRAQPYPAARHFGLARAVDTSDPRSRAYFERLTARAHADGAPGTQTYMVSRFPDDDVAARTVDVVLLDARDADPVDLLRRWRVQHDTPVGLASVGVGIRPKREGGWRTPGSLAAQARTLEDALGALLLLDAPPAVAFVHRWRDVDDDARGRDQRAEVAGTRFGLLSDDGTPRPAFEVATGFFTGTQRVFAFNAGNEKGTRRSAPLVLLGWGLMLGLGLFYAGAPKLSALAPRYFNRHDLYREAVQRGYDLSTGQTAGLAVGLALAAGVVGTSVLRALGRSDALAAATASWPASAQGRLTDLLGHPLWLVGLLALVYGVWILINLIWLNLISGRRRLRPAQALSLAVWSRWGWLPLMILSLLLGGVAPETARILAPTILLAALAVEVVGGYRMMLDLQAVSRVSPVRALLAGYGIPFALAVAGLVVLTVVARAEIGFLWHLATRS